MYVGKDASVHMDEPSKEQIREWVRLSQGGDSEAFDQLVLTYYDRVYRMLYNIVKNEEDAREVSQQTWVKIWRKIDTFQGKSAFYTWAYRIGTFTAWDFIRKRKRKAEVEYLDEMENQARPGTLPNQVSVLARPDEDMGRTEIRERFFAALEKLSEKHKQALILREVEGLSYEEIAQVMDCQKGTVMSRIFNARKAMQTHLKDLR